ncbi:MAG: type II toxin-antitoxin system VapC family toxin [Caldilineaceae bacterium]
MIVLDTSAVIFSTIDTAKLSIRAAEAIEQTDRIVINSISIWEIGWKVNLGKLKLPFSVEELVARLKNSDRIELVPVTEVMWLKNVNLAWEHRDPADRTIVATALLLGCPLISNDYRIQQFYPQTLW